MVSMCEDRSLPLYMTLSLHGQRKALGGYFQLDMLIFNM